MKRKQYIKFGVVVQVVLFLLLGAAVTPASASHLVKHPAEISLNAAIYLPTATLQPLFQQRINQQAPGTTNTIIAGIVNQMPQSNQGWARQMATTLIQPSAVLTGVTPQQDGLATSLRLSLYPGDPKPIDASMLVKFSVLDSSTLLVSATPMAGSPALVNGPLTTFHMPVGKLTAVAPTPSCGDSALSLSAEFPVALDQGQATPPASQTSQGAAGPADALLDIQQGAAAQIPADAANAYVAIPATSLAELGSSMDTLHINKTLSAQNIRLSMQDGNLVVTSDIAPWDSGITLATATTYMQPAAENGKLVMHVVKTSLTVLVFTFPQNSYNQQIEQLINSKLSGMLPGSFSVTDVALGSNEHIPCAAADSLILTGSTNLG